MNLDDPNIPDLSKPRVENITFQFKKEHGIPQWLNGQWDMTNKVFNLNFKFSSELNGIPEKVFFDSNLRGLVIMQLLKKVQDFVMKLDVKDRR